MMQIIVKRFCLSHNGEIYTAGDVVEIEDTKTAKRLVANSGGTFEIYSGDEIDDVEDGDNGDNEDGAGGIPAVDPATAVQMDNTSPKGKGRGKGK